MPTGMTEQLEHLPERVDVIERLEVRVGRLEERMTEQSGTLERIERKLDRLIDSRIARPRTTRRRKKH